MTSSTPRFTVRLVQRRLLQALRLVLGLILLCGCQASEAAAPGTGPKDAAATIAQQEGQRMRMIW